ncbi:hypothetical protein DICVIV_08773 [Dictyocaulus viviparus]|uniref:Uncharacterized protein n=1 Tax=Dictyocaulus viviparus TaxID=29172 RepID=A0A0D8XKR7_DICVI|nr:hypothetical protein DICVIV_08773 [Dictyocaulus viviparus]
MRMAKSFNGLCVNSTFPKAALNDFVSSLPSIHNWCF